jgi:hypothetical protein
MGAVGGHGGFRRHAGMGDGVRARHMREVEALGHHIGTANFLIDFHARAGAHDLYLAQARDRLAGRRLGFRRQREHSVGRMGLDGHGRADRRLDLLGQSGKIGVGRCGAQRELHVLAITRAIDGEAGAVGPAVAHGAKHAGQ